MFSAKITLFLLKNRKNRSALGASRQTHYASGGWGLRPQAPALALFHYEFFAARLIINATFA